MIVGSLLLILVAVTMLILGLAAGSSALLIGSIAASLLAAVALVVGARQAATARAEAGSTDTGPAMTGPAMTGPARTGQPRSPLVVDLDDDPGPATAVFDADPALHDDAVHRRTADTAFVGERFGDERHDDGWSSVAVADRDGTRRDGDVSDEDSSDPTDPGISARDADSSARAADTAILHSGDADDARIPFADVPPYRGDADAAYERPADDGFSAWSSPVRDDAGPMVTDDDADRRAHLDLPEPARAGRDDVQAEMTTQPMKSDPLLSDPFSEAATAGAVAADDVDEDPADEPLPQRVQPTDAIRVSRMTVDVLVVDGRPRYHLADCSHLVGRETEPIPVAEAVDLGFTACGLCRPVDVLVTEASRR